MANVPKTETLVLQCAMQEVQTGQVPYIVPDLPFVNASFLRRTSSPGLDARSTALLSPRGWSITSLRLEWRVAKPPNDRARQPVFSSAHGYGGPPLLQLEGHVLAEDLEDPE